MIDNMSVKLQDEQNAYVKLVDNFTDDSEILFNNLNERYTNLSTDIEKNTQLKNEIFSDIVRNMNASFQTLIEDNEVKTESLQKRVNDALHNLRSEFVLLSKELRQDQTSMNESLSKHYNDIEMMTDLLWRKDCTDKKTFINASMSGVYEINPEGYRKTKVYCDMTTDGGGWTVMQRHSGYSVDFQLTWVEYEKGFGDPNGDYWLGNKLLHIMTSRHKYELRIVLTNTKNNLKYAVYKTFRIGDSSSKYKLTIEEYSGDAEDRLAYHNGMKFSTKDQDNDHHSGGNCATYHGPWWHSNCCQSALNRMYSKKLYWLGSNALKSVMMIRRL